MLPTFPSHSWMTSSLTVMLLICALYLSSVSADLKETVCKEDPLHPDCSLTLWPDAKPLNPKSARICDKLKQISFPHQKIVECEQDDTCLGCRTMESNIFRSLNKGFNHDPVVAFRTDILRKITGNLQYGYLFVVGVNSRQLEYFRNWCKNVEQNLNLDVKNNVFIIAGDEPATAMLTQEGYLVENIQWIERAKGYARQKFGLESPFEGNDLGAQEGKKYDNLHSIQNTLITFAVHYFVSNNIPVIQADIDTYFTGKPIELKPLNRDFKPEKVGLFEYLNRVLKRRDVVVMSDTRQDEFGPYNTGFVVYKPTYLTKRFTETMVNLSEIKLNSDQELFNTVLRHYKMQQLARRALPRRFFTSSLDQEVDDSLFEHSVVAHFPGPNSKERLKKFNMWLLD